MTEPVGRSRSLLTLVLAIGALIVLAISVKLGPSPLDVLDAAFISLREPGLIAFPLDAADALGSLPVWIGITVVIAALLATISTDRALQWVAINAAAELATTLMKIVVDRPRPEGASTDDLLVAAGFPSGHVTHTAVFFGGLLVLVPWCVRHPRFTILVAIASVVVMAIARVSSRAHHMSDVLGACLLAAALLAVWSLIRLHDAHRGA